ncbi:excinuclease ABC subunit UvrB [candidate division WWE3 bacterium]|nr:excinuclease ABC subunit UvrB [candidate division WWE3 bacterium]
MFNLQSQYTPTGDQPKAIEFLTRGVLQNKKHQVLVGVTGSGKTFTVANVIKNIGKPTLVISHNKTLAAQLYQEFRDFFPDNAVEYFVSYYDYYQPESYIPQTDTYIEKDSAINEEIDKLRLATTTSLMTRKDVIVVASVSCIYNLGSPAEYSKVALELRKGMKIRKIDLLVRLDQIHYERNEFDFKRGSYRVRGDVIDIFPAYGDTAIRTEVFDNTLITLVHFDPMTGTLIDKNNLSAPRLGGHSKQESTKSSPQLPQNHQPKTEYLDAQMVDSAFVLIYPAKHYITAEERRDAAIKNIERDLAIRLAELKAEGKQIEAYRLEQKTNYDLEMIQEIGYCKGIENYSRYFDGRNPGDAPYSLMDFFPKDYLLVIDESHISIPQIRGMYNGDFARKSTLINYGFRLPSALDNRPLQFEEFLRRAGRTIYTSATPADWELSMSGGEIVEQLIRPTGIPDPEVEIRPSKGQVENLTAEIRLRITSGERILVTTLTKRMAEELSTYLTEQGIKVTYLHSDIETLERTSILDDLRRGNYDVLVGINLLREGLDLPEVSLVAILDADKEGFLRSVSSLVQTMGRAARHINGKVIMYADRVTKSMQAAISEVERRRETQIGYNLTYGITPISISKPIREKLIDEVLEEKAEKRKFMGIDDETDFSQLPPDELKKQIKKLTEMMKYEAEMMNFEKAAILRDKIRAAKKNQD